MPESLAESTEPSSARESAYAILRRLRDAGFEAYFAGGCVRDLLMHLTPKDFDVATNAAPAQVRGLFKNTQSVGAAFGVILVRENKVVVEVATFRTDLAYTDGRHPTGVEFSTAQEDAKRRDFTINGLFLDPVDGRIIDYVDGQVDLTAKRVRAIGNADQRFAEDHLRMLRAIRFASRLGFDIEPGTARAIAVHAGELIRISPERIGEELRKMLTPPTRLAAYVLLEQLAFVPILLRFLPQKINNTKGNAIELFASLAPGESVSFGLSLAAMTLEFQMFAAEKTDPRDWLAPEEIKRSVHALRQALKISNDESAELAGSLSFVQLLGEAPPTVAILKRFLNQSHSTDAMRLMTAIAGSGLLSEQIRSVLLSLQHWQKTDYAPTPLITGDDLTRAGASPGPKFKSALDTAYDAQLEGKINSRDQAMKIAMDLLNSEVRMQNAE